MAGSSFGDFYDKWSRTEASERANKDRFLIDLCRLLELPEPDATRGDSSLDVYVFERDAFLRDEAGRPSVGKMDLYREGCFILEAKQGSTAKGKKVGTARRDTPGWHAAMSDAFGQAVKYARTLDAPPPFLVVCDIGYCFDLYACFDGSGLYRPFENAQKHRIYLRDLADHRDRFRAIWLDPLSLDPQRRAERITRDLAEGVADLAVVLEGNGHKPELVAKFLMRCIFTMFAEDIGLLKEKLFTKALEKQWIPEPHTFVEGVEALWDAMNGGKRFWLLGRLLHFNGGLFADPVALPLDRSQLELLHRAASRDWADVEPSIFGTLLERALDPEERHSLGAHFTPREYVERLLAVTIEQPLRAEWDVVRAQVRQLVPPNEPAKSANVKEALLLVQIFHKDLCRVEVLDPACGTGNFLYVALDIFKRIESEIVRLRDDLGEPQRTLEPDVLVTPRQFRGIEVRAWAKEIAELVLWIGYLQWHHKTYGNTRTPPEPVLTDYRNVECRDALLVHDGERVVMDANGKPTTRWDGRTMKVHSATWKEVPDDDARVPIVELANPGKASWPRADYIVGNPPFVGNKRMRAALTTEYVDALRVVRDDVPATADYVMYWWSQAAQALLDRGCKRFGLITTNSITQSFNRQVIAAALDRDRSARIAFAIPDHPWVDATDGAAVRIAMTVVDRVSGPGVLGTVVRETARPDGTTEVGIEYETGLIRSNLSTEVAAPESVGPLIANRNLCLQGCKLVGPRKGPGFCLTASERAALVRKRPDAAPFMPRYVTGNDLTKAPVEKYVIDFFGCSETEAREAFPEGYQLLVDRVKPFRDQNPRETRKRNWWLFGENAPKLRRATADLKRFIATSEVAKNRAFVFLPLPGTVADGSLAAIADDDAFVLGVLSSRQHLAWALRPGVGTLEDRPRYQNGPCFDSFPFPECDESLRDRIREVAEALDAHRKARIAAHPKLTITSMYTVLEKLRHDVPLTIAEHAVHRDGLVSVLKSLHDNIDALVGEAYGWAELPSEDEMVARFAVLNAERAEEERRGSVRWLRETFQRSALPSKVSGLKRAEIVATAVTHALRWPKDFPHQVAAVRELFQAVELSLSSKEVAVRFAGAVPRGVVPALDTLTALGILAAYGTGAQRKWKGLARTGGSRPPPPMQSSG